MKKMPLFIVALLVAMPAVGVIPVVKPVSPDDIPVEESWNGPSGLFLKYAPAENAVGVAQPVPVSEEESVLDSFEINTDDPLDMNWDAQMEVLGTVPEPAFELKNDFLQKLPFRSIQNLEIKYKWLKWAF